MCGDGDEPYVLEDAEIRNADAVVAATGHDEDNLVVCLLGKLEYSVPADHRANQQPRERVAFHRTIRRGRARLEYRDHG